MNILDLLFGNFRRTKKEALIKANINVSKETQAEECNNEMYSWLRDKNKKGLGVPVK